MKSLEIIILLIFIKSAIFAYKIYIKCFFFLGKNVLKLIELIAFEVYNIDWYFITKYT